MKNSILLIALGLSTALSLPAQGQPFRLILADAEPPLVPNSIMDIALAGGYFERAGVEVELIRVQQTPMAMAALQAGEGEMANVSTEALVALAARGGSDIRAVTSPNKALPYLIAGRKDMTLDALAGQSFGIGRPGSLDHGLSLRVLASKGVDVDALQIVALGQPNIRAQALAAGQVDATTMSIGALLALPGSEALPILVSVEDYYAAAPVVSKVNAVTQDVLAERGPEVEAVISALTLAARDMAAEPQAWAKAMAALRPDVAPETLAKLSASYQHAWSVNGGLQVDELNVTSDWLYAQEDFKDLPKVALQDWVDLAPADRVLEKLGTSDAGDKPSR